MPLTPHWRFLLDEIIPGAVYGDLTAARTRRLSWTIDGGGQMSFTMPGEHPQTALLRELQCNVFATRNGEQLFAGMPTASQDQISATLHTTTFTVTDYRGLLNRRLAWTASRRSFRNTDQSEIAWALIEDSMAISDWWIWRRNPMSGEETLLPTGVLRDRDYDPGKKVGEAIQQLSECEQGFDWDVAPWGQFRLFYPYRGQRPHPLILAYGSEVMECSRSVNSGTYANAILYTGAEGLQPAERSVSPIPAPQGRFEAALGNPDLALQSSVDERADGELTAAGLILPAYTIKLAPGWWEPGKLWLGDEPRLLIVSGRLAVDARVRVVSVDVEVDDTGDETVSMTLESVEPSATGFAEDGGQYRRRKARTGDSMADRMVDTEARIEVLERVRGGSYLPDLPVGTVIDFAGWGEPKLWMLCDGRLLDQALYFELFQVLGMTWDAAAPSGQFRIPNLAGRSTVAAGLGFGLTDRPIGSYGGQEKMGEHGHTIDAFTSEESATHGHITTASVAAHTHGDVIPSTVRGPDSQTGAGVWTYLPPTIGTVNTEQAHTHWTGEELQAHVHALSGVWTNNAGEGTPWENMHPFAAMNKLIRVLPTWRPDANLS